MMRREDAASDRRKQGERALFTSSVDAFNHESVLVNGPFVTP
jgi:hypothetical protein